MSKLDRRVIEMNLTVTELTVDGVQLPTPALEGLTITENKLWSANTGRLESTGTMAGTIVAIKRKLEIKWQPLSMEDCAIINSVVSSMTPFHTMTFTDEAGVAQTMEGYFGDPTYGIYSYSLKRVTGVTVSFIEK